MQTTRYGQILQQTQYRDARRDRNHCALNFYGATSQALSLDAGSRSGENDIRVPDEESSSPRPSSERRSQREAGDEPRKLIAILLGGRFRHGRENVVSQRLERFERLKRFERSMSLSRSSINSGR